VGQYRFDITEKVIDFAYKSVKDMPGNNGQEVLVERLPDDAQGKVEVVVTTTEVPVGRTEVEVPTDIRAEGEIVWKSNHPDAIEIIINRAEEWVELFIERSEVAGPWELADAIETGNWKVVGWDQ